MFLLVDSSLKSYLIMFIVVIALCIAIGLPLAIREEKMKNKTSGNNKKVSKMSALFEEWVDKVIEKCPTQKAKGYVFNIYDNGNKNYSVEIVATKSFNEEDEDWACDELWASREHCPEFMFKSKSWEIALKEITDYVKDYLDYRERVDSNGNKRLDSKYYSVFTGENSAVAVGFVEGDLNVLYSSKLVTKDGLNFWAYRMYNEEYVTGVIGDASNEDNEYFYKFGDLKNVPKEFSDLEEGGIIFEFEKDTSLKDVITRLKEIVKENKKFFDKALNKEKVGKDK